MKLLVDWIYYLSIAALCKNKLMTFHFDETFISVRLSLIDFDCNGVLLQSWKTFCLFKKKIKRSTTCVLT